MARYLVKRLVGLVPNVLLLLALVVLLVELIPGDIVDIVLAESFGDRAEARALFERELGLDKPLPLRYLDYSWGVVQGDLGVSLWTGTPVLELIARRAFVTIEVAAIAIIVGTLFGVLIGTISAVKQDSWIDYVLRSIAIAGISVPNFAIATALIVFPAIWWGFAPTLRFVDLWEDPYKHFQIILLPALVLATSLSASLMRLTRTTMLDVMRQDYIRTARAKGIEERAVIFRHALKNSFIPVLTLLGLQVAFLIGGVVITESVFAIPGIGRLLLDAINTRDYPIIQGVVVVIGAFVMLTNIAIDVIYVQLDPRIKFA